MTHRELCFIGHPWGDLPSIFSRVNVTRENRSQTTSLVTKNRYLWQAIHYLLYTYCLHQFVSLFGQSNLEPTIDDTHNALWSSHGMWLVWLTYTNAWREATAWPPGGRLTKAYDVRIKRYRNSHAKIQDSKMQISRCRGSNFVWNFKGALWNFTHSFEPIRHKICILLGVTNCRLIW